MNFKEQKIAESRKKKSNSVTASMIEAAEDYDHARNELELYLAHTSELYPQKIEILKTLMPKIHKGTYDPELALKSWSRWVDTGAKRYKKEFADPANEQHEFPQEMRHEIAKEIEAHEKVLMENGEYEHLNDNPPATQSVEAEVKFALTPLYLNVAENNKKNLYLDQEMMREIKSILLKVKQDGETESVSPRIILYVLSSALTPAQREAGLCRQATLLLHVPEGKHEKYLSAIKKKLAGFKVEQIPCYRHPQTQKPTKRNDKDDIEA